MGTREERVMHLISLYDILTSSLPPENGHIDHLTDLLHDFT